MTLSVRRLAFGSVLLAEALGLLAFLLTPEIERGLALALVGGGLALRLAGLRFNDAWLRAGLAGLLLFGGVSYFQGVLIALVLARTLVPVQILLWMAVRERDYRYWRLGIAFVEIVLAAILSPETHMFLVIFAFILVSFLSLSFGFLERNFERRQPSALNEPVPAHFVGAVVALSFLIFLSSLLIFPLLPRSNWSGMNQDWAETDYTESVSFRRGILAWADGTSRPLVWMFLPEGGDWPNALPGGLVRARALDRFDGVDWTPADALAGPAPPPAAGPVMELFREPMATEVLPAPYGTAEARLNGQRVVHLASGEWMASMQRNRRVRYELTLGSAPLRTPPSPTHLGRVDPAVFPGLVSLAKRIGRNAATNEQKIAAVSRHFADFRASLAAVAGVGQGPRHPVETFLVETKSGHCELFATATALMLRELGVPARVVTGFRVARPAGSVVMARSSDAHAWAEAWTDRGGWQPVDTTPAMAAVNPWFEPARNVYEWLNAYWYRYILGYEFDFSDLRWGWLKWPVVFGAALLLLFGLVRRRRGFARAGHSASRPQVTRAWRKLEKMPAAYFETPAGREILALYLELRFGRAEPDAAAIREFSQKAARSIRAIDAR